MGRWDTCPWNLHIHTNLAIVSFPVYYNICIYICIEISVILPDFVNMQAVPVVAKNPGDATADIGLLTCRILL